MGLAANEYSEFTNEITNSWNNVMLYTQEITIS